MNNTPALIGPDQLTTVSNLATVFLKSGLFSDTKTEAQAVVKILAGLEIGLQPFEAMRGLDIISGKPVMNAGLISSRIKASGKYDFRVVVHTTEVCEIHFYQDGKKSGESRFTMEDAKNAGLLRKDVWRQYPRNMLYARALTNGARWYCPDVFGGAIYTAEELTSGNGNGHVEEVPNFIEVEVLPGSNVVEQEQAENYRQQAAKRIEAGEYKIEFGSSHKGKSLAKLTVKEGPWLAKHREKYLDKFPEGALELIDKRIAELREEWKAERAAEAAAAEVETNGAEPHYEPDPVENEPRADYKIVSKDSEWCGLPLGAIDPEDLARIVGDKSLAKLHTQRDLEEIYRVLHA